MELSEVYGTTPYNELVVTVDASEPGGGVHSAEITFSSKDVPTQEVVIEVYVEQQEYSLFIPAVLR